MLSAHFVFGGDTLSRYRLIIDDERKFFSAFDEAKLNFNGCALKDVIIEPEENLWQITIITDKTFNEQTLQTAEEFLRNRYGANAEFKRKILDDSVKQGIGKREN